MATTTLSKTPANPFVMPALKTVMLAWLVAGSLDIISAILLNGAITGSIRPLRLLQGVASGAFGKEALTGGIPMALAGLLFHYFFALVWVLVFFFGYPFIPFLQKHKIISGLLYGIFVWIIMNRVVVPLSRITPGPFRWDRALMNMAILMVMIGLPISLFIHKYYEGRSKTA